MKKTTSILLIVAMVMSLFVTIPMAASGATVGTIMGGNLIGNANLTAPNAPNISITNPATGATAVTSPDMYEWTQLQALQLETSWKEAAGLTSAITSTGSTITDSWKTAGLSAAITTPTYDKDDFGNVKITDKAAEVAKLVDAGYTLIVQDDTMKAEAASKYPDAKIVLFSGITSGTDANNLANYCLYGNITNPTIPARDTFISGTEYANANIHIDGAGYTISVSSNLFEKIKNISIKNITFEGSLSSTNHTGSLLDKWENHGWVKVENVTISDEFTLTSRNKDNAKGVGVLVTRLGSDTNGESYFKNIYNGATVKALKNSAGGNQNEGIGGLLGKAYKKVTFENILNSGSIIVGGESEAWTLNLTHYGIGGIAGAVPSQAEFTNCFTTGSITVNSDVEVTTNPVIGGIVGFIDSNTNAKFTNCMNEGTVTSNAKVSAGKFTNVAGIVGYSNRNVVFKNCVNKGDISATTVVDNRGSSVAGIIGRINAAAADISNVKNTGAISATVEYGFLVGGIAGWLQEGGRFTNCSNEGAIELTATKGSQFGIAGIMGGSYNGKAVTFEYCYNKGPVSIGEGNSHGDIVVGGISGLVLCGNITAKYCKNEGAITSRNGVTAGGIVAANQPWNNNNIGITIENCVNEGAISGNVAGGIFGTTCADAAAAKECKISNCYNKGTVTGATYAGGIVGASNKDLGTNGVDLVLTQCRNEGTVSAPMAGGILGVTAKKLTATNCENKGSVSGRVAGGIVGRIEGSGDASVTYCTNTGAVGFANSQTDNIYVGGIIANLVRACTINNCTNSGAISVTGGTLTTDKLLGVGGILGYTNVVVSPTNCVNSGNINVTTGVVARRTSGVGGIIGNAAANSAYTFSNLKNAGTVTVAPTKGSYPVGGILGRSISSVTFTNCHNASTGAISISSTGTESSTVGAGGIFGGELADSAATSTFTNCLNEAKVSVASTNSYGGIGVGGIAGLILYGHIVATSCKNTGEISGITYSSAQGAGGIVGTAQNWGALDHKFEKCYNTGKVTSHFAGGIFGCLACENAVLSAYSFVKCGNTGAIDGLGGEAGGIVAHDRNYGKAGGGNLVIDSCFNQGSVSARYAGGIVGHLNRTATIENALNSGKITATHYAGGLVGMAAKSIKIDSCGNSGEVTATNAGQYAGGIVGYIDTSTGVSETLQGKTGSTSFTLDNTPIEISKTYNSGYVHYSGDGYYDSNRKVRYEYNNPDYPNKSESKFIYKDTYDATLTLNAIQNPAKAAAIGGIVGGVWAGTLNITECQNSGEIKLTGGKNTTMGGIVGSAIEDTYLTLDKCANYGAITSEAASGNGDSGIGGIIGTSGRNVSNTSASVTITDCLNAGAITNNQNSNYNFGGIAGSIWKTGEISGCKNTGAISSRRNIGGIVGRIQGSTTVTECINEGNITVPAATTDEHSSIAGIVGRLDNASATINADVTSTANTYSIYKCFNKGSITIAEGANLGKTRYANGIAGIVGRVTGTFAIKDCVNEATGDITSKATLIRSFGGVVGYSEATQVSIVNCANKGDIKVSIIVEHSDWTPSGGIMGYNYKTNATLLRIYDSTNSGLIEDTTTTETKGRFIKAGILGGARGVKDVIINNCVNSGAIKTGALDEMGQNHSAGILAIYGSVGNWMGHKDVATSLTIERCTNTGAITGKSRATAGILGSLMEVKDENNTGLARTITLRNCLNDGNVTTTSYAGGILYNVHDGVEASNYTVTLDTCINGANATIKGGNSSLVGGILPNTKSVKYVITNCLNQGTVGGAFHSGGIIGKMESGNVSISNCVNAGRVWSKNSQFRIGGIIGIFAGGATTLSNLYSTSAARVEFNANEAYAGGIVGRIENSVNLTDCHNYGSVSAAGKAWYGAGKIPAIGGVVGGVQTGTVVFTKCSNSGTLTVTDGANSDKAQTPVGGILGSAFHSTNVTFNACLNQGNITLTKANVADGGGKLQVGAGGIIGNAGHESGTSTINFYGCINGENAVINVSNGCSNYNVGGIAGLVITKANTTFGVYNNGTPDDTTDDIPTVNKGAITGSAVKGADGAKAVGVGGIAGAVDMGSKVTFDRVANTNTITSASADSKAGGIVGAGIDCTLTFTSCENGGTVTGKTAGGFVGYTAKTITLSGITNAGTVNGNTGDSNTGAGGIVGVAEGDITLQNCSNTGAITGGCAGGIIGYAKNTAEVTGCTNNANIKGKYVGGIVGRSSQAIDIINCTNGAENTTNKITNTTDNGEQGCMGGILGLADSAMTVKGCRNYQEIVNTDNPDRNAKFIGGLVGKANAGVTMGGTEEGDACVNYGAVVNKNYYNPDHNHSVGGVIGNLKAGGTFINVTNNGAVTSEKVHPSEKSHTNIGGIIGIANNDGDYVLSMTNCVNNGVLSAASGNSNVGGMVGRGYNKKADVTFNSCSNTKAINGKNAGGLFGWAEGSGSIKAEGCTNSGAITATEYAGGFVGVTTVAITVNASNNTGNITANNKAGGVVGYTSSTANITGFTNDANISARIAGGIAGDINGTLTVTGSQNGTVKNAKEIKSTGGTGYIGGIAGFANGLNVKGFTNYAKIVNPDAAERNAKFIGGFVGQAKGTVVIGGTADSDACVNYGDIDNKSYFQQDNNQSVGGIVGNLDKGGTFTNVTNNGAVTTGAGNPRKDVFTNMGGIVGVANNASAEYTLTLTNCTNNGALTSQSGEITAGGMVGRAYETTGTIILDNCDNTAAIEGRYAGGLVGYTQKNNSIEIKNGSSNTGAISYLSDIASIDKAIMLGGLVGYALGNVSITNSSNSGLVASTTTVGSIGAMGGLVGQADADLDLNSCVNSGEVKADAERYHTGGLVGYASGNKDKTITNCVNNAPVSGYKHEAGTMMGLGGFVGYAQNGSLAVTYSVNNGKVALIEKAAGNKGKDTYVGGLIGRVAGQCAVNINYCINNGDVDTSCATADSNVAGGIIGDVQTWNASSSYQCTIKNTVNNGNVSGYNAGGIFGLAYPDGDAAEHYSKMVIENCINNGDVTAINAAGGIFAWKTAGGIQTVEIINTVNTGKVNGNIAGGIVADSDSKLIVSLDKVVNLGKVEGTTVNPLTASGDVKESAYLAGCVAAAPEGTTYLGNEMAIDDILLILDGDQLSAITVAGIEFAIAEGEDLVKNEDAADYVKDTWNNLTTALTAAKGYYAETLEDLDLRDALVVENGQYNIVVSQGTINEYQGALTAAIDGLTKLDEFMILVDTKIAEATAIETAVANGEAIYTAATWGEFTKALAALKNVELENEDITFAAAKPALDALQTATENLVAGYDIYTAEDLKHVDGLEGTFQLKADITLDEALAEFKGELVGNGHTITLDGCGLAEKFTDAKISDLKVEGEAGGANSLLGDASGKVTVQAVVVKVDEFKAATIFTSVAEESDVDILDIISYTEAPVLVAGAESDEILISGALVMADAKHFTNRDDDVEIETAYIDGKVFYNKDGDSTTNEKVFASGEVTATMNKHFNKYATDEGYTLTDFTGNVLVQKLDGTLPYVGKELPDRSNVVVESTNGGFMNPGSTPLVPPAYDDEEPEAPVELDFTALNAAITAAGKLDQSKYAAESWKALQSIVAAAKAALEAEDQLSIDIAAEALTNAMGALKEKAPDAPAVVIDYSKLDAAIAKAEALKADAYSEGTWSVLQTMLALAKTAKTSGDQDRVDQAVAGLETAIAGLKAPAKTDAPATKPTTPAPKDDEGCGSVVSGAVVAMVAVMTLGMGLTFKKKED